MPIVEPRPHCEIPRKFLTMHYLENYPDTTFLIGGFSRAKQYYWIFSRLGGKRDDAYNVRLGKDEKGGVVKSREYVRHAKFVILYDYDKIEDGVFKAFRVKNIGELTKEQMIEQGYVNPGHERYLCYFFDEEITLGEFNIEQIIAYDKEKCMSKSIAFSEGQPIFITGNELMNFRR